MTTNFVHYLQERKGISFSMCSLSVGELEQIVYDFVNQMNERALRMRATPINWNSVRVNRPLPDPNNPSFSKLLLLLTSSGNVLMGYYAVYTGVFISQGGDPTLGINVDHWVEWIKPELSEVEQAKRDREVLAFKALMDEQAARIKDVPCLTVEQLIKIRDNKITRDEGIALVKK